MSYLMLELLACDLSAHLSSIREHHVHIESIKSSAMVYVWGEVLVAVLLKVISDILVFTLSARVKIAICTVAASCTSCVGFEAI